MVDVWILAAKRTPIGKAHGQFRNVSPEALAAAAIRGALQQAGVPAEAVDEVIFGNAVGPGGNLARVALLAAGLPASVPGLTVDRQCGGGLEAVRLAAALIRSGAGRCYVAGGVESTSQEPLRISAEGVPLKRARFAPDDLGDPDMGEAAETLAERLGISREAQDRWAHRSQTRTLAAIADGLFASELVPVPVPGPTGKPFVDRDETLRRPLPLERLRRLPPAFREYGTITAGNACRRNDGAAALVLASGAMLPGLASATGLRTLARLLDVAVVGVPPELPGLATAAAVQALLERTGLGRDDIDLYEINEPFAALALACIEQLGLDPERVNVWGGALGLGHPYAATGAILLVRLIYGLERVAGRFGIATLASAGGLGLAALIERPGTPPDLRSGAAPARPQQRCTGGGLEGVGNER